MIVLGFDTATSATSVALRLADGSTSELRDDPAPGEHPGHATRLLPMAQELLAGAGAGWREVGRIAVGVGPGTFTGLRVGVATARGLAQSLQVELVGVGSLRALAQAALEREPAGSGSVLALIDARRGEVFAAAYRHGEDGVAREVSEPQALAPEGLRAFMAEAVRGSAAAEGWLAVGDGALRYRPELEGAGAQVPLEGSRLHLLRAGALCTLAARSAESRELRRIVPDYRRRPDAELALELAASGEGSKR